MTTTTSMTTTEATIIRHDGDGKPLAVNVNTGVVERHMYCYTTPIKGEVAKRLFLDWVGVIYGVEVLRLIKACNRAASRKQLATDSDRLAAVWAYMGMEPAKAEAPKPHLRNCACPKCFMRHIDTGCRVVGCKACFK